MEYLEHEDIAYCTVFTLKLSQDELEVYESCMRHVFEKCNQDEIYELTGCKAEDLKAWQEDLKSLILTYVPKENLPGKYKVE